MKKSKLSIGLVTSFIGVLALTACGEVTDSKDAIVTFKGYDGSTIKVLTDSVYGDYRKSSTGVSTYYNAILETLVRYQYQNKSFDGVKTYNEVVSLAENKVKADKATAESNASTNGTSYNDEWEKILDAKGCEDEAELKEYYIYSIEKEQLNDWIYNSNKASLTKEYIGLDKDYKGVTSKVTSQYPYHVRHILVKIAGSASDYIQSSITADEINKLYTVVNKLTDDTFNSGKGYLFADVAKKHSEDDGSKVNGGDVGIVTPSTSFINEFKLGLYAFDAVLSKVNKQSDANKAIYTGLGLNDKIENSSSATEKTVAESIKSEYLSEVPYVVFEKLNEYAKVTTDEKGEQVNDNQEVYYPRNIIFNQYLNIHNPFVITNDSVTVDASTTWTSKLSATNARFMSIDGTKDGKKVLCDELGHVIVGVRGEYGIHFMVMEKSIFQATNALAGRTSGDNAKKYSTNLEEYYSTLIPTDTGFPTYIDAKEAIQYKVTYVNANEEKGTKEAYSERAETIKSSVKGFDSTYDYRLYEALIDGLNVKYQGTLKEDIEAYINNQRNSNKASSKDSINSSWRTYIEMLEQQNVTRANGKSTYQLVPTTCAVSFSKHSGADWEQGGQCHNAK